MSTVYQSKLPTLRQECIAMLHRLVERKVNEMRPNGPSAVLEQLEHNLYELTYCYLTQDATRAYHAFVAIQNLL